MSKDKLKNTIVTIWRMVKIVRPIIEELLDHDDGETLQVSFKVKRNGPKRWNFSRPTDIKVEEVK